MKNCARCSIMKKVDEFHKCSSRIDGLQIYCKTCAKEKRDSDESKKSWAKNKEKEQIRKKAFYEKNKSKIFMTTNKWRSQHPEQRKLYAAKGKYNLSNEQYKQLMSINNCEICKCDLSITKHKHIDHCHETGKVRGVLCSKCNLGLGHFKDNITNLEKAIDYLKNK